MRIEPFLSQSPIFQTRRIARAIEASINLVLEDEDLRFLEALILAALFFEKKGMIQPSHLATALQTTRANVSHLVSSLEGKGLVQRKIDPEDARALQLLLLPQGKKRAVRVVGILDRIQRQLEETMGAAKLAALLAQMSALEELCSRWTRSLPGKKF